MNEREMITEKVIEFFEGKDPLAEANEKMKEMGHEELACLVFVAANKVGMLLKGSDYDDALDAAIGAWKAFKEGLGF